MRITSFNINGVRARPHQLKALAEQHQPLALGLQEIKVADEQFPAEVVQEAGFDGHWHGQKGHYGVAVLHPPGADVELLHKGWPWDDPEAQRRVIISRHRLPDGSWLKVLNGYFPQGDSRSHPVKFPAKAQYYRDLLRYLQEHCEKGEQLVVMGDMNVAPVDTDIGIGPDNAKRWLKSGKASFLPEEREWLQAVSDWGLTDTFRHLHPAVADRFSWFDYRSRGFEREPRRGLRIDLVMATAPMLERLTAAGIDYDLRGMEKPSDHCPVWADFEG